MSSLTLVPKGPEVLLGNRRIGSGEISEEAFGAQVPAEIRQLLEDLSGRSELLKLTNDAELTSEAIFAARSDDLRMLERRISEFERVVDTAVRTAIQAQAKGDDVRKVAESAWQKLRASIPPVASRALLKLDSDRATLEPTALLEELKTEFHESVNHVGRLFTAWLQLLAEQEIVGLVHHTSPAVARYHYFLYEVVQERMTVGHREEVSVDESKPFGQRTTYHRLRDDAVWQSSTRLRETHHIVGARVESVGDFAEAMPPRVVDLLKVVPDWLRASLQVVSGEITQIDTHRTQLSDEARIETIEESVAIGSPALVLGPFVLAGWSARDLKAGSAYSTHQAVYAEKRKGERAAYRSRFRRGLFLSVVIAAIVIGIGSAISAWHTASHASAKDKHRAWVESLGKIERLTVKLGGTLAIPGEEGNPVEYAGKPGSGYNKTITLTRHDRAARQSVTARVPISTAHEFEWGSQILSPEFGVLYELHVIDIAGDGSMTYAITPMNVGPLQPPAAEQDQ